MLLSMRLILKSLLAAQPGKGEVTAHGLHIFGGDPTQGPRTEYTAMWKLKDALELR